MTERPNRTESRELASELIGLEHAQLDAKPSPEHAAGNERTIHEVCEHVLHVQNWLLSDLEGALRAARCGQEGSPEG